MQAQFTMNWNTLRLVGIGGISMLSVLFVVLWHAVNLQQSRVLAISDRLEQLEQPREIHNIGELEKQLQSIQNRLDKQSRLINKSIEIEHRIIQLEQENARLTQSRPWPSGHGHKLPTQESWNQPFME